MSADVKDGSIQYLERRMCGLLDDQSPYAAAREGRALWWKTLGEVFAAIAETWRRGAEVDRLTRERDQLKRDAGAAADMVLDREDEVDMAFKDILFLRDQRDALRRDLDQELSAHRQTLAERDSLKRQLDEARNVNAGQERRMERSETIALKQSQRANAAERERDSLQRRVTALEAAMRDALDAYRKDDGNGIKLMMRIDAALAPAPSTPPTGHDDDEVCVRKGCGHRHRGSNTCSECPCLVFASWCNPPAPTGDTPPTVDRGTCVCNSANPGDGPDDACPVHGRPDACPRCGAFAFFGQAAPDTCPFCPPAPTTDGGK